MKHGDFAKSRALHAQRACFLGVLTCSRIYMLACSRDCCAYMLACLLVLFLRTHMSYMFIVLKYLIQLLACIISILVCLICFTFKNLNSKNSYIE